MNCNEARPLISAWIDGELQSDELRAHVESCAKCSALIEKYRKADDLLRAAAKKMAPPRSEPRVAKIVAAARWDAQRRTILRWSLRAAAALFLVVAAAAIHVNTRTAPPMEVVLYARPDAVAGSPGRLMFLVRNHQTGAPVIGARVKAHAGGSSVETVSDASGVANISFTVPEQGKTFGIVAEVSSDVGRETISHSFAVRRPIKLLVTNDKPLYQPTQTVHIRLLAMNATSRKPLVGDEVSIEVRDPNGNKVFRADRKTSEFGSAACDFTLADEIAFGTYRLVASIRGVESERPFEVKRYVLPKFKTDLALDRTYYAPRQTIAGRVQSRYFFGEPVAAGTVRVTGETWQVDRFATVFSTEGRTDDSGAFAFHAQAPEPIADTDLRVTVEVTDGAEHTETAAVATTVSNDDLKVWVLPEGGAFVPGIENRLFVVTAYPDGALAKTTLGFASRTLQSEGIAEIATSSADVDIVARDEKGLMGRAGLTQDSSHRSFLVRPDSYRPRAGRPLTLAALAAFPEGTLYVDLVREGVTLLSKTMDVRGGKGELTIDLQPDAAGTVQLSAYRVLPNMTIERDTRTILVEAAGELAIAAKTDRESVRPGEEIGISLTVRDAKGRPAVAELALAIVDEAVFSLHESHPGLEKVAFWVQENLLAPRYQIKDCPPLSAPAAAVLGDDSLISLRCATATSPDEQASLFSGFQQRQREIKDFARHFNSSLERAAIFLTLAVLILFLIFWRFRIAPLARIAAGLILAILLVTLLVQPVHRAMYQHKAIAGLPNTDLRSEGIPPRVRKDFPETLYWNPSIITDDDGRARVTLRAADSITTWRLAASAVSATGDLGATDRGIMVFQELFIDIDLPAALTQGDVISVPVACHNYLKTPQDVTVRLALDEGFAFYDQQERQVHLEPGEVRAVHFKVRATGLGPHALTAIAQSAAGNDRVQRRIEILPDGRETNAAASDSISGLGTIRLNVPKEAIDGSGAMWVRLYPSRLSEIVTGLEGIVRMPHGCFEQTSSTTYPNALVMGYLEAAGQLTPEWRMKIEAALSQGYQRLLAFQQKDGGFAWYANGTSSPALTAYGLVELTDMGRVYSIDPSVIARARALLESRRRSDGSWPAESRWWNARNDDLAITAYVTWAILEAGGAEPRGTAWIESHLADVKDAHTLALVANALVLAKSPLAPRALVEVAKALDGADAETLALATLALLRGRSPAAEGALAALVRAKDPQGSWPTTQATIVAIKALLEGGHPPKPDNVTPVTVRVNGHVVEFDPISAGNFDVVQQANVTRFMREGANEIEIACERRISAQVAARWWVPWSAAPQQEPSSPLRIETRYDKERLTRGGKLRCNVTMRYRGEGTFMVIADLGVPPGFDVDADTFERLVASKRIDKYSITARRVTLYFGALGKDEEVRFAYDLRPRFPISAMAPGAEVYEYYAPDRRAESKPVALEVGE